MSAETRKPTAGEDKTPSQIEVWVCEHCGYWRQEKSTGVHRTPNPQDPRGAWVTHPLVKAAYIYVGYAAADGEESA